MHQIKDVSNDAKMSHTLTVYSDSPDSGMTSFAAKVTGEEVEACTTVVTTPEELSGLLDFLITTYNRYVDEGLVDTTKYPDPFYG
jgi:hypothetical protein